MSHKNIFRISVRRLSFFRSFWAFFALAFLFLAPVSHISAQSLTSDSLIKAFRNYVSPKPAIQTASVIQSDILNAFKNYVAPTPTVVKIIPPVTTPIVPPPPAPVVKVATPIINLNSRGPQGPAGPRGPAGNSIDSSQFVSRAFFDKQLDGILRSIENSAGSTSSSGGGGTWGSITGTLSGQTDLQAVLDTIPDNLTDFASQTAWRVFYSNGSGDLTELALGADGTFLKSNGAAAAPTFATPAGSGDVTKVGTPVADQIGVWTGNGTLEGDSHFTFDTTTDTLSIGAEDSTGTIRGFDATTPDSDGGDILIRGGNLDGGGSNGKVKVFSGNGSFNAIFDTSVITTADKTFTFPDKTMTFAGTNDKLSAFAATTSVELKTVISDETGSGALVFATSPTLVTPALGTPSALVGTNITGTAASLTAGLATSLAGGSGGTIPYQSAAGTTAMLANGSAGQILQSNGTTLAPSWVAASAGGLTVGSTTITSGSSGRILYNNAGTLGEMTTTGSGTVLVLATSPTLVTPNLGTPSAVVLTSATGLPLTTGVTGVLPVANGGTNCSSATITCFNNITGLSAAGTTGTTSTNLVFSTSPTLVTPVLGAATYTTLSGGSITDSALTATRVTFAGTAGLLSDDADLTFATDTLTATKIVGTTSITNPLFIGGTGTTSDLNLQTTSGVGATGADMHFLVGSNGATEAMTILNSGNVDIGAGGLAYARDSGITTVSSFEAGNFNFDTNAGANSWVDMSVTSAAADNTVESYSAQIDGNPILTVYGLSDGAGSVDTLRVGIGTTTPSGLFHVATSTTALGLTLFEQTSADADSYDLNFRKARGTVSSPTVITTADELGVINFRGYGGAAGYITGAAIKGISSGTIADSRIPGQLSFWTGTDAAPSVSTERMTIDNAGKVGVGDSTPDYKLDIETDIASYVANFFNDGNATTRSGILIQGGLDDHTAAGPSTLIGFQDGDGGAVGSITFGSSATAYNTTSDQRLKNLINEKTDSSLNILNQIKVHDFSWKEDTHDTLYTGIFAQELYDVYPHAITKPINEADYWMVDYSKLTPVVIASIQELDLKLEGLEERITALEANGVGIGSGGGIFTSIVKSVEGGVAYLKGIVTETLKIGSPTKRTGITLYDEATGDPYCLSIVNGEQKTTAGECKIVEPTPEPTPTDDPVIISEPPTEPPSTEPESNEPEVTPEPTPEVTPVPDPVVVSEPTPEPTPEVTSPPLESPVETSS